MRTFELLLIEDNPGYVRLTAEALKESKVPIKLNIVEDGAEALSFLYRKDNYAHAHRPDLILLDLNLPKTEGKEVLAKIKNDPDLRRIPVIILTVSNAEKDILMSYNLHSNAYIIKPADLDQFISVIKSIVNFWFTLVALPSGG